VSGDWTEDSSGEREEPRKPDVNGFEDVESWLTPLSTADGGKPPTAVDASPRSPDKAPASPVRHPRLGVEPVDNGPTGPEAAGPSNPAPKAGDTDLARAALAGARRIARPRRRGRDGGRRTRRENLMGRNKGGYSGPGPDSASDPQRIGPLLAGYLDERGWDKPLAQARVFAEWPALVGADVAAHCAPQSLNNGELRIAAESTAWATQLRLLSSTLLARLVAELGPQVVTKLIITGPVGPSWKHGGWSVRGGRGPRDTYG
jgi:predicted nucleic acid-binding Zn ribbon protein